MNLKLEKFVSHIWLIFKEITFQKRMFFVNFCTIYVSHQNIFMRRWEVFFELKESFIGIKICYSKCGK